MKYKILLHFKISQALFYYSKCLTSLSVEYLSSGIIISCKYRARIRSEPISPREVGLTGTRENHFANKSRLFISSNGINIWAENTKQNPEHETSAPHAVKNYLHFDFKSNRKTHMVCSAFEASIPTPLFLTQEVNM